MSTIKPISVLLVEDNSADACFIEELLSSAVYQVKNTTTLSSALDVDPKDFDVILLDLSLPDGHGLQTCISMIEFAPDIPIIILTGYDNDTLGLAAVKLGAQDYVLKQHIDENTLSRSIRYAIERAGWEKGIRQSAIQAKKSEAEARETATNLQLALRASKTGVWLWDFVRNKLTCDDQVLALFGLTRDNIDQTGETIFDRFHEDDRDAAMAIIQNAIENKCGYQTEFRCRWTDGTIRYIASSGEVIEESSGDPFRMTGICIDLTKQKQEQEKAKRLIILEQHEDFIATLTHDLKNPLIGADRLLELLINGALGELQGEQRNLLTVLKQSNSDMLALIKNLLEVYRYDEGAPPLHYVEVDLAEIARNCVVQLTASAEDAGVTLKINFAKEDHSISADLISMRRILMNLLGNGIKFTLPGGTVAISGHRLGESYKLEVEDSGSGIAKKDIDLLFRRYTQTTTIKNKTGASTGLGLYLCRQLVEAHGGQMTCMSEEGVGSIFSVVLPTEKKHCTEADTSDSVQTLTTAQIQNAELQQASANFFSHQRDDRSASG